MRSLKVFVFSGFFGVAVLTVLVLVVIFVFKGNFDNNDHDQSLYKLVQTLYGQVRGVRDTTLIKNMDFYSFKGIPYAKNPIGDLRFKVPEPFESWKPEIKDASKHGSTCYRPTNDSHPQSEDCLFLNVYVPADIQPNETLPVMVFIHGGAFSEGNGNDDVYGPDFLLEKSVILVTFNYRLGLFGFLSFDTPEYSGNMALKDQQLALKWIHENIAQFSGDTKRITLFGESAGGVMTHFHILSNESRKYFKNAILLSGSAENLWAYGNKQINLDMAKQIAENLKHPKKTVAELIKLFKSVPAKKIVNYAELTPLYKRTSIPIWAPVIERKDADRPFMVEDPEEIYAKNRIHIDAMFGVCSAEYLTFYTKKYPEIYDVNGLDRNFTLELPFRDVKVDFDSEEYIKIAADIREFYFKNETIDEKVLKQYIDLLSDINFGYGIDKAAKQHANKTDSKTFYYRFSIDSNLNVFKKMHNGKRFPGAGHADDLCHIFRCGIVQNIYDEILKTPEDEQSQISLKAIENITTLLANFAKYGEPTHETEPIDGFLPIQKDKVNFLDVVNDGLKLDVGINEGANAFWARIEEQFHENQIKEQKSTQESLKIQELI